MRIAIAGISHETNTYADESTGQTGLDRFLIERGDEIVRANRGVRSYVGGMLDAADEIGAEVVPTYLAGAVPSGTIAADAYATMRAELLAAVAAALPVDAIALELHGAGVVDGTPDLEGDLGLALRELVGPDLPIVTALDLHGNATPAMAACFDLLLPVHLYPHTDMYERGHEAVSLLPSLLDGTLRPTIHIERLPVLLPTSTTDTGHPGGDMNELCFSIEAEDGVVDCSVFHGFPFTDIADVGVTVVCTTNGDPAAAQVAAKRVAAWIWTNRQRFVPEAITPETAIKLAKAATAWPVVINDTADNPGGGTPGDATHVLRAFLEGGLEGAVFGYIFDAEVAAAAHEAGVGATIDVRLGGKHDSIHGDPIEATAYVKALTDGKFVLQKIMEGYEVDLGRCARLVIDGVDVIVSSRSGQTFDPEVFALHGIDVHRCKIVGLKSSAHFRAGFRDVAAEIITADSPGLTTNRLDVFERTNATGPLWPIDPDARYVPSPEAVSA